MADVVVDVEVPVGRAGHRAVHVLDNPQIAREARVGEGTDYVLPVGDGDADAAASAADGNETIVAHARVGGFVEGEITRFGDRVGSGIDRSREGATAGSHNVVVNRGRTARAERPLAVVGGNDVLADVQCATHAVIRKGADQRLAAVHLNGRNCRPASACDNRRRPAAAQRTRPIGDVIGKVGQRLRTANFRNRVGSRNDVAHAGRPTVGLVRRGKVVRRAGPVDAHVKTTVVCTRDKLLVYLDGGGLAPVRDRANHVSVRQNRPGERCAIGVVGNLTATGTVHTFNRAIVVGKVGVCTGKFTDRDQRPRRETRPCIHQKGTGREAGARSVCVQIRVIGIRQTGNCVGLQVKAAGLLRAQRRDHVFDNLHIRRTTKDDVANPNAGSLALGHTRWQRLTDVCADRRGANVPAGDRCHVKKAVVVKVLAGDGDGANNLECPARHAIDDTGCGRSNVSAAVAVGIVEGAGPANFI